MLSIHWRCFKYRDKHCLLYIYIEGQTSLKTMTLTQKFIDAKTSLLQSVYLFDSLDNSDGLACAGRTKHDIGRRAGGAGHDVLHRAQLLHILLKVTVVQSTGRKTGLVRSIVRCISFSFILLCTVKSFYLFDI